MVMVFRHLEAEQRLQQPVDMSGGEQILAAGHQVHLLQVIVDGDGEVIAGGGVLARQHHVAMGQRVGRDLSPRPVGPGQRAGEFHRPRHVDAQPMRLAGADAIRTLALGQAAADAGIDEAVGAVGCCAGARDLVPYVAARTEAGIDQLHPAQPVQRRGVILEMLGLAPDRARPRQPEPGEIVQDRGLELGAAAAAVDVLDA